MFARLTIGQYVPGTSWIHRLDARTKILIAFVFVVVLLLARGWLGLLYCGLFTTLWYAAAQVPVGLLFRGLRPILGLILITILLNLVLTPGRTVWAFGPVHVTAQGLTVGVRAGLRLALLVFQAAVTTLTTRPMDLTDALERLGSPLRAIGVPAHELALMTSIALRFIPVLSDEADRILKAQQARGGGMRQRGFTFRAAAAFLIPLLLSVFRRADELAVAMEARGYRGAAGRTRYRESRLGLLDGVAGGATMLLVILAVRTRW